VADGNRVVKLRIIAVLVLTVALYACGDSTRITQQPSDPDKSQLMTSCARSMGQLGSDPAGCDAIVGLITELVDDGDIGPDKESACLNAAIIYAQDETTGDAVDASCTDM
jgi:hypothetical protein